MLKVCQCLYSLDFAVVDVGHRTITNGIKRNAGKLKKCCLEN